MRRIIGFVVNGKLETAVKVEKREESQLLREYVRNDMRERYARDIVQPYKHGEVNPEYIEAYGKTEAFQQYGIRGERDD